jgi:glutamate synthase (NADPH/NADH) small chain
MLEGYGVKELKGYIKVDENLNTGHDKIFAGGDCVRAHGEASTVMAVQDGKIAARAIAHKLVGASKAKAAAVSNK